MHWSSTFSSGSVLRERPYDEVLDAWRTSCPRLPVWEEANEQGFVLREHRPGEGVLISVSAAGKAHLRSARAVQLA